MPAQATARRATARTAPVRTRPAPRRAPVRRAPVRPATPRRRPAPQTGPIQVISTPAGAVARLADSAVVVRLTRGRLWIGLLTALLVGIVGLNVYSLSLSAASTRVGHESDVLERQNSALRAKIATGLSNDRIQHTVSKLGYVVPDPGAIRYLSADPANAEVAAERLASGDLSSAGAIEDTTTTTPAPPVTP